MSPKKAKPLASLRQNKMVKTLKKNLKLIKTRKDQDEDQSTSIFSLFKKTKTKTKSFLKDILDF